MTGALSKLFILRPVHLSKCQHKLTFDDHASLPHLFIFIWSFVGIPASKSSFLCQRTRLPDAGRQTHRVDVGLLAIALSCKRVHTIRSPWSFGYHIASGKVRPLTPRTPASSPLSTFEATG
ncbi:uncharacterized protein PHACADRAFT_189447 [Phanerochaete carnosa HHB-10118-sp]|uniref:Uncharacterized protein n=1 Tax=Phanerochaete carnosa (strain HHB-10118-sp) TaxID=650164 RepID=K5XBJ1_PHACS|nr:uncharacterized protein PHACADRAFT_189447 [Phanerochaete carnosa HHB-10118-sp]EKM60307.1 hypothetical protein PHACADRAFT_189447 [Phanerochaete carnosa HHB-10118-sp]